MTATTSEIPFTPENVAELKWEPVDEAGYVSLRKVAEQMGLRLPDSPKAIRGGKVLGLPDGATGVQRPEGHKTLEEFLSSERDIGVFPAYEGDTPESNGLIFLINEKGARHFEANLTAWKSSYAVFLKERWEKAGRRGPYPILEALKTYRLADGRTAIVTKYEHGYESLGSVEPDIGVHQADLKQLPDPDDAKAMDQFIDVLHGIAINSREFSEWERAKDIPDSWLKEGNAKCALRGHEWWYNPKRDVIKKEVEKPDKWGDRYIYFRTVRKKK